MTKKDKAKKTATRFLIDNARRKRSRISQF